MAEPGRQRKYEPEPALAVLPREREPGSVRIMARRVPPCARVRGASDRRPALPRRLRRLVEATVRPSGAKPRASPRRSRVRVGARGRGSPLNPDGRRDPPAKRRSSDGLNPDAEAPVRAIRWQRAWRRAARPTASIRGVPRPIAVEGAQHPRDGVADPASIGTPLLLASTQKATAPSAGELGGSRSAHASPFDELRGGGLDLRIATVRKAQHEPAAVAPANAQARQHDEALPLEG